MRSTQAARMWRLIHAHHAQKMLEAGDRVGVAVSGGADSVALLLLLQELREELGVVLSVVHFHHGLRGAAADGDEKFVAKLAARQDLKFYAGRADVASIAKREKRNIEEAGRRARYQFFSQLVEAGTLDRVAVGHTADDQAETVMAHLLRGTGLTGLGGIHPVAKGVIRPMLTLRRPELREYLKLRGQKWREDVSNADTTRLRARIRKKLLPLLEKEFPGAVVEHLASLADLARGDEALLEVVTRERCAALAEKNEEGTRIAVGDLLEAFRWCEKNEETTSRARQNVRQAHSPALSRRMVRAIVRDVRNRPGELAALHVENILELARQGRNGTLLKVPGGVEIRRERDSLLFRGAESHGSVHLNGGAVNAYDGKNSPALHAEYFYEFVPTAGEVQEVRVPEIRCVFRVRVIDWPAQRRETNSSAAVLDSARLQHPLVLRNWRPGDRLQPQGRRTAHKLKRLLNEEHVSRWKREGWPVLISDGVMAWARGLPIAARFAVHDKTTRAVVMTEEPY